MNLYIATYCQGGEHQWDSFASDGTRKPLKEEFLKLYNKQNPDYKLELDDIEEVYRLGEVYDHTKRKNYKIILRAK